MVASLIILILLSMEVMGVLLGAQSFLRMHQALAHGILPGAPAVEDNMIIELTFGVT